MLYNVNYLKQAKLITQPRNIATLI